jgi:hypothetical protein
VKLDKAKWRSWLLIGVGVLGVFGAIVLIVSQWGTLQPGQAAVIGGLGVLGAAGITFFSQHLTRISEVSRPAPGGRAVGREDSAVVTCCARVGRGGIILGVRRGRPRKDLGALSL